jgi:hypothetical protein
MNEKHLMRRGIVLSPSDIHDRWIDLINDAYLNVLALHGDIEDINRFINSEYGNSFLARLKKNKVDIEYEIHAMSWLLPRKHFKQHPDWFRVDEHGKRTIDGNLCTSSKDALDVVRSNAISLAEMLQPTTNRYYFWADDTKAWCRCKKCAHLSVSDQNLIVMNSIIKELRRKRPDAILSYLAYLNTLDVPHNVKPDKGIFLEFAPIQRQYDSRLDDKYVPENARHAEKLEKLIDVFGRKDAQALEYWLDSSMFSKWAKPAKQILFNRELFRHDLLFYIKIGIESITTFGVYLDSEYFCKYGTKEVLKYGLTLREY